MLPSRVNFRHFTFHADSRQSYLLHNWCASILIMAPASTSIDENIDYYEFLSIKANATDAEIQTAYRRANLKYHPDKFKPTPEVSLEQAAAKLDLLQKILGILKDPVKRAQYDQGREAKRMNEAANRKMKAERKKGKEELEAREREASAHINGVKRKRSEHEEGVKSAQAHSIFLKEAMEKQRREEQTRRREAAEAQMQNNTALEPDESHRSVKVTWVREGEGLDIDEKALKEICEAFGSVENVKVMKDKKRRIDGQKKKSVFGTGLVVFASLAAAHEAVKRVQWDILESITWALPTDTNAG